jgi:tight adherence protein B
MGMALLVALSAGIGVGIVLWVVMGSWAGTRSGHARALQRIGAAVQKSALPLRQARLGHIPAMRDTVNQFFPSARIALFLEQAGVEMSVNVFILLIACSALGAYWVIGFLFGGNLVVQAVGTLAAGAMPWIVMANRRSKRFYLITSQLPDAIRLLTSALRAGLGLDGGLQIVVSELPDPIRTEFRKLLNEAHLFGDPRPAFIRLSQRVPLTDLRLFASSARLHREIGGNFAILLDRLERTVRDRMQLNRELRTLTAESRMTGWIIGLLPVIVAGADRDRPEAGDVRGRAGAVRIPPDQVADHSKGAVTHERFGDREFGKLRVRVLPGLHGLGPDEFAPRRRGHGQAAGRCVAA